jgi:outer membrane protein OmpA-like peptidoglycan-associated protein
MERRFHHDFSAVRVHSDERSAAAASQLSASAFTMGRDIFFGANRYAPDERRGVSLLAHELAHTLGEDQRSAAPLALNRDSRYERAADAIADSVTSSGFTPAHALRVARSAPSAVYRKLLVDDPDKIPPDAPAGITQTNAKIVDGYVRQLTPNFQVSGGRVVPINKDVCKDPDSDPTGLCVITQASRRWRVRIDDSVWPGTVEADHRIDLPPPYSAVKYGSWSAGASSHRISEPPWLLLGHELAGHAKPMQQHTHVAQGSAGGGRTHHDEAITAENKLASQHGVAAGDLRGTSKDHHKGESFGQVSLLLFPPGSSALSDLPPTQQQRIDTAAARMSPRKAQPGEDLAKADIIGHAGDPDAAKAVSISKARANAVRSKLVSEGVPAGKSFGVVDGVGSTQCTKDKTLCERVDVFMYGEDAASVGF